MRWFQFVLIPLRAFILGVFLGSMVIAVPMSAVGQVPVPSWINSGLVPHLLDGKGYGVCGAVVAGDELWTAAHCVKAGASLVWYNPTQVARIGKVLCRDQDSDFARFQARIPWEVVGLGVERELPLPGQFVWIVGWPEGRFVARLLTVVNVITTPITVQTTDGTPDYDIAGIITVREDAVSRGGISGGAMLTQDGKVLGIMAVFNKFYSTAGAVPIRYTYNGCPR